MPGTSEGSTESGFMEKPGIEPATPCLQDIGLSPLYLLYMDILKAVLKEIGILLNNNNINITSMKLQMESYNYSVEIHSDAGRYFCHVLCLNITVRSPSCWKTRLKIIDVAPITQLRTCVIKIANIQWRSPNVVKVIFHTIRNCS